MIIAVDLNMNRTDLSLTAKIIFVGIVTLDTISIILVYS